MIFYDNATDAIRAAITQAPCCVAYRHDHSDNRVSSGGWFVYDPTNALDEGDEPEFFVARQGTLPVPLSIHAIEVWASVVLAALNSERGKTP